MNRARTLTKGAAALVLLAALAAGIPWALARYVGWPLPHRLPTPAQLTAALSQHGIADNTLIKTLACVVWIAWAALIASLAVEGQAVIRGGTARRLSIAGPLQPAVGQLLAAIAVAALSLSPRATPAPTRPLATSIPALRTPVPAVALAAANLATAPTAPTAAGGQSHPVPTSPAQPHSKTYQVQRNDTLWGIAQRQLGDPLRWRDIYNLNHGRPQPDGATLTDPHWITQGWTLLLPAPQGTDTSPPPTARPSPPSPTSNLMPGAPAPTSTTPASTPTPTPHDPSKPENGAAIRSPAATHEPEGATRQGASTATATLPSGSVVGASFAAGVLAAITVGWLRRRHGYQPAEPEPGRCIAPPPLGPTLRRLSAALAGPDDETDSPARQPMTADDDRRVTPDLIEIGERDGHPVTARLTDLSGTAISGNAAEKVARAWIAALLTRAGPLAAEVIATDETLGRLFGSGPPTAGIRTAPDAAQLMRSLDTEVVARSRLLESSEAADAASYRQANPAEPLPGLLYVLDRPSAEDTTRLCHTIGLGPRLGIAVISLGATNAAATCLRLEDLTFPVTDPSEALDWLAGARLFGLTATEGADILGALTDTEFRPTSDENPEWTETIERFEHPAPPAEPWPIESTRADTPDIERPIRIQSLGPLTITALGNTINRGLRSIAKELLVYYLLRPEGATVEQAVDHLWPDTDPKLVHRQFWTAASNLRSRLREWGDLESKILHQVGDVYRLDPDTVSADLWDFQIALDEAARTGDDNAVATALRHAVNAYGGDLAQTAGWLWLEPAREDLHRRAVNAHLRLAELELTEGNPGAAEATLEKIIDLDRYAEEPYRRLMTLHASQGRTDSVKATWRQLQRRLVEIDLDPDPATARLYRTLASEDSAA